MNTLEQQWIIYRDAVYPKSQGGPDPIQEIETRQAYFAGCLTVLKFAVEASSEMPEEQAFKFIGDLIKEAQQVCEQRIYEMKGRN